MESIRGCSVEGCNRTHLAKGYCAPHYHRMHKYGDTFLGTRPGNQCTFPGCVNRAGSMDICKSHRRQRNQGRPLTALKPNLAGRTIADRMESQTDRSGDCWEWLGARIAAGYGCLNVGGRSVRAHRVAYELAIGPIPEGAVIDHKCHNPGCVRPQHLQAVSQKENNENRGVLNANNRSGVRGVSWSAARKKWLAEVTHNRVAYRVGAFESLDEAREAVIAKRNELFTNNLVDQLTKERLT